MAPISSNEDHASDGRLPVSCSAFRTSKRSVGSERTITSNNFRTARSNFFSTSGDQCFRSCSACTVFGSTMSAGVRACDAGGVFGTVARSVLLPKDTSAAYSTPGCVFSAATSEVKITSWFCSTHSAVPEGTPTNLSRRILSKIPASSLLSLFAAARSVRNAWERCSAVVPPRTTSRDDLNRL